MKIIATILCLILVLSCNSEKRIARKDNAAIERVTAKRSSIEKLIPVLKALYPDSKDTLITIKIDTLSLFDTTATYIRDTMLIDGRIDTLVKIVTKINNITKTKTVQIPDLKGRAMDAQIMANQDKKIYEQTQFIVDEQSVILTLRKEKSNWLWLFIAACISFALSNGIWIYATIAKKVKSI